MPKFKRMVEYLIPQAVTDKGEDKWHIGDNGKVLIGHAILWFFVSGGDVNFVARCLYSLRRRAPSVKRFLGEEQPKGSTFCWIS